MTLLKWKNYENRQPGYTDCYTIKYYLENGGGISMYAVGRPKDPFNNPDESHVGPKVSLICVSKGKEPRTFERAEAIAHAWMLNYSEYIRTGRCPRGSRRVEV